MNFSSDNASFSQSKGAQPGYRESLQLPWVDSSVHPYSARLVSLPSAISVNSIFTE